jgi:hypothetical protein
MLTDEQLKNTPFICEISNEDYHTSPGLSRSGIVNLLDCPIRYWDNYLNPEKAARKETEAMRFGTLVHCALLEPELFAKQYHVIEKLNRNSKEYKEAVKNADGKEVLFIEELQDLTGALEAVNKHKIASELLKNGKAEQSIYWHDKETNILCKARPDYMTNDYIVDIKTTNDASLKGCQRAIEAHGYHIQAAMILAAFEAISGRKCTNFINIFIESKRPYIITNVVMSDQILEKGFKDFRRGLAIYKQCSENNYWPSYVDEIEEIQLSPWALKELNEGENYAY